MTTETKHTPTPWEVHDHKDARHHEFAIIAREALDQQGELGVKVASVWGSKRGHCSAETSKANAAFIVRACNAHDELLELAAECLWRRDYPNGGSIVKTWNDNGFHDKELYRKEALAAAKGGA